MNDWLTPAEILTFNQGELPNSERSLYRFITEQGWRKTDKARKNENIGGGWLYHISLLPASIQVRIKMQEGDGEEETPERSELWLRYDALTAKQKAICAKRLAAIVEIEKFTKAGMSETTAVHLSAKKHNVSSATVFNWKILIRSIPRADWKAALAPSYSTPKKTKIEVNPDIWECLKSDYLRPEKPSFTSCYRRVKGVVEENGWGEMPNARTLRRKLNAEVPSSVQTLAREGKDVAKTLYPAQRRTRSHLHAMQMVNMDGHKLDVFVRFKDGKIGRMYLVAIQDLFSNKFVAWRMSYSENKETVRLVIGDMVETFGIPEDIYLDNGRSFASKWITGRMKTRYRFKIKDEEPSGLITTLGITTHWTTPYSGQSKPIERAFKDFCDTIARHPYCAGAYTGGSPTSQPANYGSNAIDEDKLRLHVDNEIRLHNAREDRNTENAKGISFDQAFLQSIEAPSTIINWPSHSQKSLWLLAGEQVTAKRGNGEIKFYENRYWSPELTAYAGKKVTVRFDPDRLEDNLRVYDVADQFICEAKLFGDVMFNDVAGAKLQASHRNQMMKLLRDQEKLHVTISAERLGQIYASNIAEIEKPIRPSIPRIVTSKRSGNAQPVEEVEVWDEETENYFSKGLRLVIPDSE